MLNQMIYFASKLFTPSWETSAAILLMYNKKYIKNTKLDLNHLTLNTFNHRLQFIKTSNKSLRDVIYKIATFYYLS